MGMRTLVVYFSIGYPLAFVCAETRMVGSGSYGSKVEVRAGFSVQQFSYNEVVEEPKRSSETGTLPGFEVGLDGQLGRVMWGASFQMDAGSTTFDGTDQDGQPVPRAKGPARVLTTEGNLGYQLYRSTLSGVSLYGGIGTRYWNRGATGNLGDYTEEYLSVYLPIGIRFVSSPKSWFSYGLDGSALWTMGGGIKIYTSQIDPGYVDSNQALGSKVGFRFRAPMQFRMSGNFSFRIMPYLTLSSIGQGDTRNMVTTQGLPTDTTMTEPESHAWMYGIILGPAFSF